MHHINVMKLEPRHIDINKAIAICTRDGVTVSSVQCGRKFKVRVDNNGVETVYDKSVYAHRLNSAINKTWRYHAAIILNNNNGK